MVNMLVFINYVGNLPHLLIEVQIELSPVSDKVKAMDNFHMVQQITCHRVGGWTIKADLGIQILSRRGTYLTKIDFFKFCRHFHMVLYHSS